MIFVAYGIVCFNKRFRNRNDVLRCDARALVCYFKRLESADQSFRRLFLYFFRNFISRPDSSYDLKSDRFISYRFMMIIYYDYPQKHPKRKKAFDEIPAVGLCFAAGSPRSSALIFLFLFVSRQKEKGKGATGEFTGLGYFADNHIIYYRDYPTVI